MVELPVEGQAQSPRPNVELQIEALFLDGFPAADRYRIGDALQSELGRLLAEAGVPPGISSGGEIPRLDAGPFAMRASASPQEAGRQVAQAVYRALGGEWRAR